MTREHAKELLPIITAFANGGELQCKTLNGSEQWGSIEFPNFEADPGCYRIAPKPRKVWVNEYASGHFGSMHITEGAADVERVMCSTKRIACHEIELPPIR